MDGRIPRARTIFHLAAAVHALAGWSALAPVNLDGLGASIALARRDGALVQLASTLSVFVSSNSAHADAERRLPERHDLWLHRRLRADQGGRRDGAAPDRRMCGGRWFDTACSCLRQGRRSRRCISHRPSSAHCSRVGAVPDQAERAAVDLTPVAGAARAAIRLARTEAPCWRHWANPEAAQLSETIAAIEAVRGRFPRCRMKDWLGRLRSLPRMDRALLRSAFDKSGFLAEDAVASPVLNVDLFQSTLRRFVSAEPAQDAPPPPRDLLPGVIRSMLASQEQAGA